MASVSSETDDERTGVSVAVGRSVASATLPHGILGPMASAELPDDVSKIIEYLAMSAEGYGGPLLMERTNQ